MTLKKVQALSDEELRIKVAECLGLGPVREFDDFDDWWQRHDCDCEMPDLLDNRGIDLPDYPKDLNAMHEAEKKITSNLWMNYVYMVRRVILTTKHDFFRDLSATARQRAEAFVLTMNERK